MKNKDFDVLVDYIFANYKGDGDKLTRAMGSLVVAQNMGWEVLLIMTSENTFKKHEKILHVDFKKDFDRRGKYAHRSLGIRIIDKMNNFWDIVQRRASMSRYDKICID